jgi:DNA-binding transcriptional LysR family regulator
MDWNDLRHFLAVARAGSTLAAAETLKVNQSTVARRIGALEQALGVRLFDRLQSGYRLTAAGREILPAAERLEIEASTVLRLAEQRARRVAGTVRVTTNEPLANLFLNPCIREFTQLYPDVLIEVAVSNESLDLDRGEADVALRAGTQSGTGNLRVRKLRELQWSVYASRDYARRNGCPRTPGAFAGHAIIGGDAGLRRVPGPGWLERHAGSDRVVARSNSVTHMVAAVKAGLGLAALPCTLGELEPELVRCLPPPAELDSPLWLVTRADLADEPRIRTFTAFMSARIVSMRHLFEIREEQGRLEPPPTTPETANRPPLPAG